MFRNTDFEIGKVQGGTTFGHGTQIVWGSLRSLWADETSALHTAARTLELDTESRILELDTAARTHGKSGRITALQKDVWNSNRKSVSPMTCVVSPV